MKRALVVMGVLLLLAGANVAIGIDGGGWDTGAKLLENGTGADGDSSETDTDSGLEKIGGSITLIRGCSDNQILKWDETNDDWNCEADAGAAGGDSITVDTVAVTDPDFADGGDINFTDTANTITADLKADVVEEDHIADDGIDSEHYNDGSIDAVHLAADVIDETKIADDGIDSEHYNDGSVDAVHLADTYITPTYSSGFSPTGAVDLSGATVTYDTQVVTSTYSSGFSPTGTVDLSGAASFTLGAITVVTTGEVKGAIAGGTSAGGGAIPINEVTIATAAADYDLPDSCDTATFNWAMLYVRDAAETASLTVTGSEDTIIYKGLSLGADDELDSPGAAQDSVTVVCMEANKWYVTSNSGDWTDGGAAD